jgi:tRNA threonylcarbamoyladenosine dehydratase
MKQGKEWEKRTVLLVGEAELAKLHKAHVLVAGLGGVGSSAAEFLCRAGIGKLTIADHDQVQPSNRNRQIPALQSTEGQFKADVMAARLKDINPDLELCIIKDYLKDESIPHLLAQHYDHVVDAIDTLSPKFYLILNAVQRGLPVVSSMGAGGRLDPALIKVSDISASHNCRLAYYIRKKLHKFGIYTGVTTVFSSEMPIKEALQKVEEKNKKSVAGTISYMPVIFGGYCASVVIRSLLGTSTE